MNVDGIKVSATGLLPNKLEKAGYEQDDPDEVEIEAASEWLRLFCKPRKTINPRYGSYTMKHIAEHWAGDTRPGPRTDPYGRKWCGGYISNGAMIVALLRAGYRMKSDGMNADFNVSIARSTVQAHYSHTVSWSGTHE